MLGHAPLTQQVPVLLLAAIHDALLRDPTHRLAHWYPNLTDQARDPSDPDLVPTLTEFVTDRTPTLLRTLQTRRVQTNEVGRSALFLPAFALVAADVGTLTHLDVGASAGLNTLLTHYSYRYDDRPLVGHGNPVIACSTRGTGPVPDAIPAVAASTGVDLDPPDLTDPDDARWIRACCWPDQIDRFDRLAAAIDVAIDHPPVVIRGDAAEHVRPLVTELATHGHPVVTTSWVLDYFEPSVRRDFVARLDDLGGSIDLSWVIAEAPERTPELPHGQPTTEARTALTLVTWRAGERRVRPLATCHPHGYWLHWP